jgi:hypothetical protein
MKENINKKILEWFHTILIPKTFLILLKNTWYPLTLLHQYYCIQTKVPISLVSFTRAVRFCNSTVFSGNIHLRRYKCVLHVLLFDVNEKKNTIYVNDYKTLGIDSTIETISFHSSSLSMSSSSSISSSLSSLSQSSSSSSLQSSSSSSLQSSSSSSLQLSSSSLQSSSSSSLQLSSSSLQLSSSSSSCILPTVREDEHLHPTNAIYTNKQTDKQGIHYTSFWIVQFHFHQQGQQTIIQQIQQQQSDPLNTQLPSTNIFKCFHILISMNIQEKTQYY